MMEGLNASIKQSQDWKEQNFRKKRDPLFKWIFLNSVHAQIIKKSKSRMPSCLPSPESKWAISTEKEKNLTCTLCQCQQFSHVGFYRWLISMNYSLHVKLQNPRWATYLHIIQKGKWSQRDNSHSKLVWRYSMWNFYHHTVRKTYAFK